MLARVTRFTAKTDKFDEMHRTAEEQIDPDMKDDPGFKGIYVLGDRSSGDSLVITMWDTPETEEASRENVARRFGMIRELMSGEPQSSDIYEVVHSFVPSKTPAV